MGAFLQSIIYGFAGFRIRPDKLEIHNPTPPPGSTEIRLVSFYYLGSNMTFTITAESTTIEVLNTRSDQPLILRRNATGAVEESIKAGMPDQSNLTKSGIASRLYPPRGSVRQKVWSQFVIACFSWGFDPQISPSPEFQRPPSDTMCRLTTQMHLLNVRGTNVTEKGHTNRQTRLQRSV